MVALLMRLRFYLPEPRFTRAAPSVLSDALYLPIKGY